MKFVTILALGLGFYACNTHDLEKQLDKRAAQAKAEHIKARKEFRKALGVKLKTLINEAEAGE